MPEICPSNSLPKNLQGNQTGISVTFPDGTVSGLPLTSSPWWDGGVCTKGDACKLSFMDCASVSQDGKDVGNYCIAKPYPPSTKQAPNPVCNAPCNNTPYGTANIKENYLNLVEDSVDPVDSCTNWPDLPCKNPPNSTFYHSLYFYPIRGVGVWTNIGRTFPALTKLGFLLTPKNQGGPGYKLVDLLEVAEILCRGIPW